MHEFGHGLGFLTLTDETTGQYFAGFPTISTILRSTTRKISVDADELGQRKKSATNPRQLVWVGDSVTARARDV